MHRAALPGRGGYHYSSFGLVSHVGLLSDKLQFVARIRNWPFSISHYKPLLVG